MIYSAKDIISDAEIIKVHANANFGSTSPREVVEKGIFQVACGFDNGGSTMQAILLEHKLITKPKGYRSNLTVKGKKYLRFLHNTSRIQYVYVPSQ